MENILRKLFSELLPFSSNYTAFEVRPFMLKPLESVLIDMNDAFTENMGRRMGLSWWVGCGRWWEVVGVTITVTALLNNFNIPCPSARSAIMITKVQSESQLSSKLSVL